MQIKTTINKVTILIKIGALKVAFLKGHFLASWKATMFGQLVSFDSNESIALHDG